MRVSPTVIGMWSILVWSLSVVAASFLVRGFGSLRAGGIDFTIAGIVLLASTIVLGQLKNLSLHSWRAKILPGIFFILNIAAFYVATGLAKTPLELVIVSLLNYLWPIATLVFSIPICGGKATKWLLPGVALGLIGILVAKADSGLETIIAADWNPGAYSFALAAAITWGIYSNLTRKYSHPDGGSLVPFYLIIGGVLLFISSLVLESGAFQPSNFDWIVMFVWSSMSATAFIAWDFGMRKGDVAAISSGSMSIPVMSAVWTMLYSGIGLNPRILFAAILVVVGSQIAKRGVVTAQ